MDIKVTTTGSIFDGTIARRVQQAEQRAIAETLKYGQQLIEEATPVVSGNLKRGWYVDGSTIQNDVFYMPFVEDGTRKMRGRGMVRKNINAITRKFESEVDKGLNNL